MSKYKRYERYKDSGVEWIGEIPEHWGVIKLKYVTKLAYGDSLPTENREEEGEVDVFGSNGKVGTHNVANTLSPVIIVGRKGSYGKVTYSDKKCFAIDTTYYIDNRCTKSNIKWLYYSLMVLELDKNSQDTGVPGLSREYAYNKYVPVPTVNEQVAIANFLDQKTAEIDSLIADKEKLIELLWEKRQAIITEAVTKGLNPNVRMKDSGIEWIGEIPEHWRIVRLKFLKASPLQYGANEPAEMDDPQMPRYIRITDINEKGDLKEDTFKSLSWENAQPYLLKDGDILFARSGATVGKTFIYKEELGPACYAGYLIRFRPDKNKANPYYIYYYTLSKVYEDWIKQNIIQATIQNVSAEKYGNLQIPVPPMEEQKRIVKYLNNKIQGIDILVESIHVQIQKLKEYRQSLISEAVTGKIDVRDWMLTIKLE